MNNAWLAHHGIAGQKWGHRNGPPYPLDEKDHSASEKKAGWKKSLDDATQITKKAVGSVKNKANSVKDKIKTDIDNKKKEKEQKAEEKKAAKEAKKKQLTPEQIHKREIAKKVAIGAAVVAGTALAIYGAKKLNDSAIDGLSKSYKYAAQEALRTATDYRRFDRLENAGRFGRQRDITAYRNLAKDYQNKVRNKDYSLKEKADYHLSKLKVKGQQKILDYNNVYGYQKLNETHNSQMRNRLKSNRQSNIRESYKEAAREARNMIKELERDRSAGHEASNKKSIDAYRQIMSEYQNRIKNNDFSLRERANYHATRLKSNNTSNYTQAYGLNKLGNDWARRISGSQGISNAAEGERWKRIKAAKRALGKLRSKG